ncbi:hypothetical protein KW798_02040 [Candidatus Parcubacteria bacterium]|nr:hypothetical protein [Candidatus Parcubacteria bacterium]
MSNLNVLRDAYQRAIHNEYSSFYRTLYGAEVPPEFPQTEEEWNSIPFVTKKDILATPMEQRIFVPAQKIDSIRCTSGTSGTGILCMPRSYPTPLGAYRGSRILSFYFYHHITKSRAGGRFVIAGDQGDLETSAKIAAEAHVDSIQAAPSVLIALAEHLSKHMQLVNIRQLLMGNERMTELQMQALKRLYPSAELTLVYTSTDSQGPVAVTPPTPVPGHPRALEPLEDMYVECIDEQGSPLKTHGSEGELLLTTLIHDDVMPLVRYRIGDRARLIVHNNKHYFEILSRAQEDGVRIGRGELYYHELERAVLRVVPGALDFEAVVTEVEDKVRPLPKLSITIFTHDSISADTGEKLAHAIRVSQQKTYAHGVAEGLYAPLVCEAVPPSLTPNRKRRHLIDKRI